MRKVSMRTIEKANAWRYSRRNLNPQGTVSMKTSLFILAFALFQSSAFASTPKYLEPTKPLSADHSYFERNSDTDFWQMIGFYRAQETMSSCSVATVVMVVNSILHEKDKTNESELTRHGLARPAKDKKVLFKMVKNAKWDKATKNGGGGTTLAELTSNIRGTLTTYKIDADVTKFGGEKKDAPGLTEKEVEELLIKNEDSRKNYLVANFDQAILTGEYVSGASYGHIAPIGAYDKKNKRVLVLDPDRDWYEPYWVNLSQFVNALNSVDKGASTHRGLVFLELK